MNSSTWTGAITVGLLIVSNVLMTLAWYGHLKLQQTGVSTHWPLVLVILLSWGIAFFEYCVMVPANRIGFSAAAQSHSGSTHAAGVHPVCSDVFQGRASALEPLRVVPVAAWSGVFRVLKDRLTHFFLIFAEKFFCHARNFERRPSGE